MFFITGMMGPYMRPMALNVPMAMLMSMFVAFTITPWLGYHVLKGEYYKKEDEAPFVLEQTWTYRIYSGIVTPLIDSKLLSQLLLAELCVLFALSGLLGGDRSSAAEDAAVRQQERISKS
ncbi:MAG: efflux RND transporter permease subunit [Pirellulaceae bacterium]